MHLAHGVVGLFRITNGYKYIQWESHCLDHYIAVKELLPITLACAIWGHHWRHQQILVKCDNIEIVQVITSLRSYAHVFIAMLILFCVMYDFKLRAEHIAGL